MRIHLAIFAAAGVMLGGAVAGVAPAQAAGVTAVPAVAFENASSGIEKVHRRRYRGYRGHYRQGYYRPRYYGRRHYSGYYGYPRYHRPGVVIQFGFGGGGHYGGYGGGYGHGW